MKEMVATAVMLGAACQAVPAPTAPAQAPAASSAQVANLHAFARLYGVLRWFHPSDAAAVIDWGRFACEGARRIIDAPDRGALRARLAELISPIAPTVQLAGGGEALAAGPPPAPGASGREVVAWEHEGYGDTTIRTFYTSKRRHRDRVVAESGRPSGALWQAVDAAPYRNARVRVRGKIRTANGGAGRLWLRVDRGDSRVLYDSMRERPVSSATWTPAEVVDRVDAEATRLAFGIIRTGVGTVWYDDLELSVEDAEGRWQAIAIQDPGFESGHLFSSWAGGTDAASSSPLRGWTVQLDDVNPASGHWALRVEPATTVLTEELFDEAPAPGETVDLDLGQGLRARVPLTLDSQDGHTIGDDPAAARALQAGSATASSNGFDRLCGVADVIVVWNVLEHFWPYWDVARTDWNAALDVALADALDDRSLDDHVATLERLSAAAPDGHAESICPGARPHGYLPFLIESIENQLVVTSSTTTAVGPGDIIVAIDGRPAGDLLAAETALQSGSPQYRVVAATGELGAGPVGSTATVRVRRGSAELDVAVPRGQKVIPPVTRSPIERLDDGVYYVDLGRASMPAITEILDRLAAAPGVVFDLRDYPNGNDRILSYLLTAPADYSEGMSVPRVIRPDHGSAAVASWKTYHHEVPVLTPHIAGRVAFLTGPRAISYAESVMSIVEHYHLGEIVGAPTAGTNGNIAEITTPLGCRTLFTAMRVVKRDGRPHHLVGIRPTLPASPTIAGVIAGRDEVLEKALRYVRTGAR